jgi:hypothetical protein
VQFNDALALELGLEPATLKSATGLAWLSGVEMPAEAAPLAQPTRVSPNSLSSWAGWKKKRPSTPSFRASERNA